MVQADSVKVHPEPPVPLHSLERLRRLHGAVRFALPQQHAIILIVTLVLAVACISAFEPLVLKWVFDQLTEMKQATAILVGLLILLGFAAAREAMDGFASWLT